MNLSEILNKLIFSFQLKRLIGLISLFSLISCGGGGGTTPQNVAPISNNDDANPAVADMPQPADAINFSVQSVRKLDSDGANSGLNTYDLIRDFGGTNPIESPDLYLLNHPEVPHIYEDFDADIGNHFVFISHRDIDRDRDRYDITDRQRNEIKTYSSSEDAVKGYEDETMLFTWRFKIEDGMEVSRNFSHFFQLKAVGAEDSHPIVTFTGNESSGEDGLEVRWANQQNGEVNGEALARVDWSKVTGEWLEAYVRATFSDSGNLRIILRRQRDDQMLFDIDQSNLDMWRGTDSDHFVRPKWGIYRSLADASNLRADEEIVRFANFEVSKLQPAE